ncbi:MAG: hypothetical protein ACE5GA_06515, partial [Candidatus Zixiibacteriota bacterium]
MRMVKVINNEHLSELGKPAEKLVKVECVTCHRGQSRPQLIGDALMRGFESGGVDTLIATYRKLRERHFGSHTFDFSEPVLLKSGDALLSLG